MAPAALVHRLVAKPARLGRPISPIGTPSSHLRDRASAPGGHPDGARRASERKYPAPPRQAVGVPGDSLTWWRSVGLASISIGYQSALCVSVRSPCRPKAVRRCAINQARRSRERMTPRATSAESFRIAGSTNPAITSAAIWALEMSNRIDIPPLRRLSRVRRILMPAGDGGRASSAASVSAGRCAFSWVAFRTGTIPEVRADLSSPEK